MKPIQMVDLHGQYLAIRQEIDAAISNVIADSAYIKGPYVSTFESNLGRYLGVKHVIGVGNGTDALQIALMSLGIGPGDEIIAPSFTFVATAEAAALLGATPVFADIDPETFNISPEAIEKLITPATKVIVPVHLYGQPADMNEIMALARRHKIHVIEDTAQAIGALYRGQAAGTIGDLGTYSFFPSKNLGGYGDGGAIATNDDALAESCRLIASHGSKRKYHNEVIGINSRLDGIQAAILDAKLRHLDEYGRSRIQAADLYDALFAESRHVIAPPRATDRSHIFHQYTVRIRGGRTGQRDLVSENLKRRGIPHAVYYPVPVHRLPVYETGRAVCRFGDMTHTESAATEVLSLPMHTELTHDQIEYIATVVMDSVSSATPETGS